MSIATATKKAQTYAQTSIDAEDDDDSRHSDDSQIEPAPKAKEVVHAALANLNGLLANVVCCNEKKNTDEGLTYLRYPNSRTNEESKVGHFASVGDDRPKIRFVTQQAYDRDVRQRHNTARR